MDSVRLGIVGLGFIGQLHMRHALRAPNAKVVAVADTSTLALKRAKAAGIEKTYTDYTEMFHDPNIDAVVVSLPTHLHLGCVVKAAQAKKHIFLEKPISTTLSEGKEILDATEQNHVKLMMGYPMRFNRHFKQVKTDLEDGLLGDVENVHATYVSSGPFFHRADGHSPVPVPDWWFNLQLTGGGVLMDLGCHLFNLLRWWFGEILDVKAQFGHRLRMDFEDSAMCLARFESGSVAVVNVGWFSQEYLLRLDLLGSVRNVSVSHTPASGASNIYQMLTKGITAFNQPHFDELQYFVDCIAKDKSPSPSGLDGLRDLEAILKAYNNQIII
jgi:myo-inositol 2-dehydrogenase/D-chiro-inositol 1-dehydrogenase